VTDRQTDTYYTAYTALAWGRVVKVNSINDLRVINLYKANNIHGITLNMTLTVGLHVTV